MVNLAPTQNTKNGWSAGVVTPTFFFPCASQGRTFMFSFSCWCVWRVDPTQVVLCVMCSSVVCMRQQPTDVKNRLRYSFSKMNMRQ